MAIGRTNMRIEMARSGMKEGTAKDMAEDKKKAKARGMTMKQWESSKADEKHDKPTKKMAVGGGVMPTGRNIPLGKPPAPGMVQASPGMAPPVRPGMGKPGMGVPVRPGMGKRPMPGPMAGRGRTPGGMAKGGRIDGCATQGKTKGTMR